MSGTKTLDEDMSRTKEYWASLDTPKKAVLASLKSLMPLQHLSNNEFSGMADWIVAGLSNAGFSLEKDDEHAQVHKRHQVAARDGDDRTGEFRD